MASFFRGVRTDRRYLSNIGLSKEQAHPNFVWVAFQSSPGLKGREENHKQGVTTKHTKNTKKGGNEMAGFSFAFGFLGGLGALGGDALLVVFLSAL